MSSPRYSSSRACDPANISVSARARSPPRQHHVAATGGPGRFGSSWNCCTADLDTRTGGPNAGKKVKGTIHWVSARHSTEAEVRLYDRLFTEEEPERDGRDFKSVLNPHSLDVCTARVEPGLGTTDTGTRYQFERLGYFWPDPVDSRPGTPVFIRTLTLKDTWAKQGAKPGGT